MGLWIPWGKTWHKSPLVCTVTIFTPALKGSVLDCFILTCTYVTQVLYIIHCHIIVGQVLGWIKICISGYCLFWPEEVKEAQAYGCPQYFVISGPPISPGIIGRRDLKGRRRFMPLTTSSYLSIELILEDPTISAGSQQLKGRAFSSVPPTLGRLRIGTFKFW